MTERKGGKTLTRKILKDISERNPRFFDLGKRVVQ